MNPLIGIILIISVLSSPAAFFLGWSIGRWDRKSFRIATREELDEIEGRDQ